MYYYMSSLSLIRMSQEFVSGQGTEDSQSVGWRKLIDLLTVVADDESDPAADKVHTWAEQYQESLLRLNLALPTTSTVDLTPRDIKANASNLWTKDQLQGVLDSLAQQVEVLESSPRGQSGPKACHDLSALVKELKSLGEDFERMFRTDLKAWVDRVPIVGDNMVLGDLANHVLDVLKALEDNVASNKAIRESVTSIKTKLHQMRANED